MGRRPKIYPGCNPWMDYGWAANRGVAVEEWQLRPQTFFLADPKHLAETVRRMRLELDESANPFRRPEREDGSPDRERLHVGVMRIGGIGDDLMTGATLVAFKRRFPNSHITLFARDNTGILGLHPGVDRLVFGATPVWRKAVRDIREFFDVFIDLAYVPRAWNYRPDDPDLRGWAYGCEDRLLHYEPGPGINGLSWYYHNFPLNCNALGLLGRPLIELTNWVLDLPGEPGDVTLTLTEQDRRVARIIERLVGQEYLTLHNGCSTGRQTKNWPTKRWAEVVARLEEQGRRVVQIGTAIEEHVEGCVDMRGLTTVRQMAGIIAGSTLHLDTEGGPVHIAQAVGTRSVCLYGPTPAALFGYGKDVHISAGLPCEGCWYKTEQWHARCPNGHKSALCMEAIPVEQVTAATFEALGAGAAEPELSPAEAAALAAEPSLNETARQLFRPGSVDTPIGSTTPTGGIVAPRKACPARDRRKPTLAVAIPTRNRPEALGRLLESIAGQSKKPDLVLLINDGEFPLRLPDGVDLAPTYRGEVPTLGDIRLDCIPGPRRGPHHAHHAALEYLRGYDLILRLDDDVVLESPDFIERLYKYMASPHRGEVAAIGGVYPQPEWPEPQDTASIGSRHFSTTIAWMLNGENSAQFYRYSDPGELGERRHYAEHLYSSFMYRREAALGVGGFAVEGYSPRGHREETDFTHRLFLAGHKLVIDTNAVARHERCATGGLRDIASQEQLEAWRLADEALFLERLNSGQMAREARGGK